VLLAMTSALLRIEEVAVADEALMQQIGSLRCEVWRQEGSLNEEAFPSGVWLDDLDRSTTARHWAAFDDNDNGRVVAAARLTWHESLDDGYRDVALWKRANVHLPLPCVDLGRLVVASSHRKRGIASSLNAVRIEAAKAAGAKAVMVTASQGNAELLKRQHGFREIEQTIIFDDRPNTLFFALQLDL